VCGFVEGTCFLDDPKLKLVSYDPILKNGVLIYGHKMKDITFNEIRLVLRILKSPEEDYNANNLSKVLGISPMGTLKIAKRLVKEEILTSKQIGKGIFYSINFKNPYAKQYLQFLLKREGEYSAPYIKRWISEIRKIKNSELAILFGSVLSKNETAKDIDVLFVVSQKIFNELKKEIGQVNKMNDKKIHPIFQSIQDIKDNIKKQDKVVLNAIKGIVIFGEDTLLGVIEK
jgi:predicted nucleotidyltransferase